MVLDAFFVRCCGFQCLRPPPTPPPSVSASSSPPFHTERWWRGAFARARARARFNQPHARTATIDSWLTNTLMQPSPRTSLKSTAIYLDALPMIRCFFGVGSLPLAAAAFSAIFFSCWRFTSANPMM
eukprot:3065557-Pyramimonas_sp.AAC.1